MIKALIVANIYVIIDYYNNFQKGIKMAIIKNSALLDELIIEAKRIGNLSIAPFTAERFIVAAINKLEEIAPQLRTDELQLLEDMLKKTFGDIKKAKEELMTYINDDKSSFFLDDLYMKKKMRELSSFAAEENAEEIDCSCLLFLILEEPSATIENAIEKLNSGARALSESESSIGPDGFLRPETLDELLDSIILIDGDDSDRDKEAAENSSVEEKHPKKDLAQLIADVKRIRTELKSCVYGQDNAINVFASGYFQARLLSMTDETRVRPAATFLFAGPPGVGKTLLAEKAAACLGLPFKRFDMSEYADKEANIEFCGSDSVYKNSKPGNVTSFVAENPKCVLLFDEIEKAHITAIHLFLQMLDAGRLRDNFNDEEVSFRDAVIIITTNAGKQLYEESESGDLSAVSRKVIIKALQKDVDPRTQVPYFPAAMVSRFASGNVVMFNHISAHDLCTIAESEILRHSANFEKRLGVKIETDEKVFAALLFSEGASVDARTIRGRAESFFNDELYELLRLVSSEKSNAEIEDIDVIRISVDLDRASPEIAGVFDSPAKTKILVLSSDKNVKILADKASDAEYLGAQSFADAIEIMKNNAIDIAMLDMRFGATLEEYLGLNIEDAYTPARELLNYIRVQNSGSPVFILEDDETVLTDEEKISFVSKGVRGVIDLTDSRENLKSLLFTLAATLHRQASMKSLARQNKLIAFSTAQSVTKEGIAEIRLFDFRMEVAIDSEDSKNILSALSKPDVKFDSVIGASDAKAELSEFINYLKDPKKYAGTGLRPPKGVLLYGPPGTGKTMLAKAMASEADMTFIAAEGNQFLKKFAG